MVAYSWWSSTTALGVARALDGSGIPVVSRAHGYALFAEQEAVGFVAFQAELLRRSTAVRSVSEASTARLRALHSQHPEKVSTARLGVAEHANVKPRPGAWPFHVLSCSAILPVQRIELISEAVGILRRRVPPNDVRWTHIGSGLGMPALEQRLAEDLEVLRCTTLLGQISPEAVMAWYADNPVDVAINVSSSEMVGSGGGVLLPADPTPVQIADALAYLAGATAAQVAGLREWARRIWQTRYSASRNYAEFTVWLVSIALR